MHTGVFGPLAFRKDFFLNVNSYAAGWARRWLVRFGVMPAGIASVLQGKTFDCGPDTYPDLRTISWFSDYRRIGVAQYAVQLVAQINPDGRTYSKEGGVFVLNQGIIWHWKWGTRDPQTPGFLEREGRGTDFFSIDWFDTEPNALQMFCTFKFWTDGPPH
jgi:hypothetical protein